MNAYSYHQAARALLASIALAIVALLTPQASMAISCSGNDLIDITMPSGARWEMCWELRNEEGVVLKEVAYETPTNIARTVLKEASLAGINVAYNDGTPPLRPLTDLAGGGGLGVNIDTLAASDCSGGTLHQSGGSDVLCVKVVPRNYTYKSYANVKQGHAIQIESRSTIGTASYIVRWRFFDDGTVHPQVGLAGELPIIGSNSSRGWDLDNTGRVGVAFNTTYFWRLDFDLDSNGSNEVVEEFEVTPSANRLTKSLSVSVMSTEDSRSTSADLKRSWRIRDEAGTNNADGRPISYHLEPLHIAHSYVGASGDTWAQDDIHITRYNACERLFFDNPTTGGCGSDITQFVNGESIVSQDLVIWYKLNYHHVPRSEDEPAVQIHWDSFYIVPRDWTATNPLVRLLLWPLFGGYS